MPVSTQIIATEPLGEERAAALLPTDLAVEDLRKHFVLRRSLPFARPRVVKASPA